LEQSAANHFSAVVSADITLLSISYYFNNRFSIWHLFQAESSLLPCHRKCFNVVGNNKMTHQKLFLAVLFGLFSCGQSSNSRQISVQTTTSQSMSSDKEVWTLYLQSDTVYHVKRLVSFDSGYVLLTYDVNTSQPEAAHQTFKGKQSINESDLQKIKSESPSFNWTPFKAIPTLFVQMQPFAFKDEMDALDKRQQIEQLIDNELKSKNLGEWIAGDLGPGGANMLFEVQDIIIAKAVIQTILSKNGLDKATIIGRRVNIAADNWFYEVIYPLDYNGEFLTL
jgi:hypothetical protein